MPTARARSYRPTELAELSDREVARMLERGQDPARGLTPFQVAMIAERAIEKLRRRPAMLMTLARAVAARRELDSAKRAAVALMPSQESRASTVSAGLY